MPFAYVIIDGKRVNKAFADDYYRMERAFKDAFGLDIIVSDGVRTYEEQKRGYNDYISGRTSVRWANPDSPQAYHVETNKSGPRAIDIRDSGNTAGVTRYGNARSNWIRDNARRFNWNPRGYHEFNEPWHLEHTGTPMLESSWKPGDRLNEDGQLGPQTISKLQSVLGVTADGQMGPQTISALQRRVGAGVDGKLGPETISKMQGRLGVKADGQWGAQTTTALQKHLNNGGTLSAPAPKPTPVPVPTDVLLVDGQLGRKTIEKWQKSVGATVDGELGPETISKTQKLVGARVDGQLGPQTIKAIQINVGATPDGQMGPQTIKKLQEFLNAGKPFTAVAVEPEAPATQDPADEDEATPDLKTPSANDFPSWIRFEKNLDPEGLKPTLNIDAKKYYSRLYDPIESHIHWWGAPGKGGSHNGNVNHIKNTDNLSVNFVVSAGRITLMVPLNKIALTTGARNPYAWKSENDPMITDLSNDELGYRTMGYLHYIVEKLNPKLLNEPIRHHKEFYPTSCSELDKAKVRKYAEDFRTGRLDPNTGKPPVTTPPVVTPTPTPTPTPQPQPETVSIPKGLFTIVKGLPQELRRLADDIDEYLV